MGTTAGRRRLGPRDPKSPVLSLGPGIQAQGRGREAGFGPWVSPQALPRERCLQTHCRAQALGRERSGAGPCFSGQPPLTPPPLGVLD